MSYENGNARGGVNSQKSLATAPVALAGLLLLFFTATSLADNVMIDTDKWVILPIAVALAAVWDGSESSLLLEMSHLTASR